MEEGNGFVMEEGPEEKPPEKQKIKVDFSSFVLSLYSSALVQLGKVDDPTSGEKVKNLDLAEQTIDIIAVLKDKTVGNLNPEEEKLMSALLQELRISYVEAKS